MRASYGLPSVDESGFLRHQNEKWEQLFGIMTEQIMCHSGQGWPNIFVYASFVQRRARCDVLQNASPDRSSYHVPLSVLNVAGSNANCFARLSLTLAADVIDFDCIVPC